jgi:hypothetical protein
MRDLNWFVADTYACSTSDSVAMAARDTYGIAARGRAMKVIVGNVDLQQPMTYDKFLVISSKNGVWAIVRYPRSVTGDMDRCMVLFK